MALANHKAKSRLTRGASTINTRWEAPKEERHRSSVRATTFGKSCRNLQLFRTVSTPWTCCLCPYSLPKFAILRLIPASCTCCFFFSHCRPLLFLLYFFFKNIDLFEIVLSSCQEPHPHTGQQHRLAKRQSASGCGRTAGSESRQRHCVRWYDGAHQQQRRPCCQQTHFILLLLHWQPTSHQSSWPLQRPQFSDRKPPGLLRSRAELTECTIAALSSGFRCTRYSC